jgi:hypothetical protein
MNEIKMLESDEGMPLNIQHNSCFRIHVMIITFFADTKGVHELGGFMSPSANILCRLCEIRRPDLTNHSTTDSVVMRTIMTITLLMRLLNLLMLLGGGDPNTGLKRSCPLNLSIWFHIGENHILDGIHDIPEGEGPFLFKLCLNH